SRVLGVSEAKFFLQLLARHFFSDLVGIGSFLLLAYSSPTRFHP
ncbi:uncharacterized protein METZ01_LOCUS123935, partial [marine metagenome]